MSGMHLVGRRPDIVAARLRVEAAAKGVDVAKAAFFPDVTLSAYVGQQSIGLGQLFSPAAAIGSIGPAITLPIFEGGRLRGAYRGARGQYDEAVANYDLTLVQALQDVADSAASVQSAQRQLAERKAALDAGEQAYAVARLRYQGGLSSYVDVLTAENAVIDERRAYADAAGARLHPRYRPRAGARRRLRRRLKTGRPRWTPEATPPQPTQARRLDDAGRSRRFTRGRLFALLGGVVRRGGADRRPGLAAGRLAPRLDRRRLRRTPTPPTSRRRSPARSSQAPAERHDAGQARRRAGRHRPVRLSGSRSRRRRRSSARPSGRSRAISPAATPRPP